MSKFYIPASGIGYGKSHVRTWTFCNYIDDFFSWLAVKKFVWHASNLKQPATKCVPPATGWSSKWMGKKQKSKFVFTSINLKSVFWKANILFHYLQKYQFFTFLWFSDSVVRDLLTWLLQRTFTFSSLQVIKQKNIFFLSKISIHNLL